MLVLHVRCGDDVYVGDKQVIVHREANGCLVIQTSEFEYDVPLDDDTGVSPSEFDNVVVKAKPHDDVDSYHLGFIAPRDVLILTGRNYRRKLED